MNRRHFLAALPAVALLPGAARAFETFSPATTLALLDQGRVVLLDFHADWCSTCAAQERVLTGLRAGNPAYDQAITFVKVDWDVWGRTEIAYRLNVQRRSTLVLLSPAGEVGRLVAGTEEARIRALLEAGLKAAAGA